MCLQPSTLTFLAYRVNLLTSILARLNGEPMANKIAVNLPEDMYKALAEEADNTGLPLSTIVRLALKDRYKGKVKSARMTWGGKREPRNTNELLPTG